MITQTETRETLTFEQPYVALNFKTLAGTATDQLANGTMKPSRPIQHFQFLTWVRQTLEDIQLEGQNGEVISDAIFVSRNHAKRISFEGQPGEPCPIEKVLVTRLATKFYLPVLISEGNDTFNPTMSVAYNEHGICVMFGVNHAVDDLFFATKTYKTYGNDKLTYEELLERVTSYVSIIESVTSELMGYISALKNKNLTVNAQNDLSATLYEQAVWANKNKTKDYILNLTQHIRMTENLISHRVDQESMSAWQYLKCALKCMQPDQQDLVSLHPTIARLCTEFKNMYV